MASRQTNTDAVEHLIAAAAGGPAAPSHRDVPHLAQRVLIIDDSPDIAALVRGLLRPDGIALDAAQDGVRGLEMARSSVPDLVLLDVDMPDPDGFEVCRRLKADPDLCAIPVIFLTGAGLHEQRLHGLELGAVDYIVKPFERSELRARVRAALRTKWLMDLLAEEARVLQDSQERFRLIAEDSADLISRHTPDGAFLYASPAARALLGFAPHDLLSRSLLELVHPADRLQLLACEQPPLLREASAVTFRMRGSDMQYRWVEAAIRAVRGGSGFQIACRDVSIRKRDEQLERDRSSILEMVAVGRPFEEILTCLARMLEHHCPEGKACILALSEGELHVVAPSLGSEFYDALRHRSLPLAAEICSSASTEGRHSVVSDISSDRPWKPLRSLAEKQGYRICASRLIQSARCGVIGLVSMLLPEQAQPDDHHLARLLEIEASLISVAAEHRQLSELLTYQASHDSLTGLPNRVRFDAHLEHAVALRSGQDSDSEVGIMFIDLDRFKLINDTLGHQAGDELLRQLAGRLRQALRPADMLARVGGDEFAVVLAAPITRSSALEIAERIRLAAEEKFNFGHCEMVTSASIGIAFCPSDAPDARSLKSQADIALYRVKASGRNGALCFMSGMDTSVAEQIGMESRLRAAIENGELSLHFQPQVSPDGNLVGLEALLRWENPELGNVPPGSFIPVAEESGMIVPMGSWVLHEACRQGRAWREAGLRPTIIAVNVSALQFAQADFCEVVLRTLEETGYDPRFLEVEATESLVMRDIHDTARKLRRLAEAGVRIAIDDFGTGYSSLAYLQELALHRLKIDRSFVCGLPADPSAAPPQRTAIVRAITSLGHSLGMAVVAEGVEQMAHFEFLRSIKCDSMQGFLFCPPRPAADVVQILRQAQLRSGSLLPPLCKAS